jgi:hypothetical protein
MYIELDKVRFAFSNNSTLPGSNLRETADIGYDKPHNQQKELKHNAS